MLEKPLAQGKRGPFMLKILIIDDEPRTRRRLAAIISQSELDVEVTDVASNGIDGLAKAKLLYPDIIITDVRMPQMDGILLSSEIKKFLPDCQIIFISGYSDKEYLRSAISLKAVCYVEKPFEPTEMLEAIRSAMDIIIENRRKTDILRQNQLLFAEQKDLFSEKIALELLSPQHGGFLSQKIVLPLPGIYRQLLFLHTDMSAGLCQGHREQPPKCACPDQTDSG